MRIFFNRYLFESWEAFIGIFDGPQCDCAFGLSGQGIMCFFGTAATLPASQPVPQG
jgi:hypothetical protein